MPIKRSILNSANSKSEPLTILLTFLVLFSGILVGLYKSLDTLIEKQSQQFSPSILLLIWIITFLSYYLLMYIATIVKAIFYYTVLPLWKKIDNQKLIRKQHESYCEVRVGWSNVMLASVIIFLSVVYRQVFGVIGPIIAVIIVLLILLEGYFLSINDLMKKENSVHSLKSFRRLLFHKDGIHSLKTSMKSLPLEVSLFIMYCLTLIIITSGVEVQFDKELYSLDDTVIAQVRPYGIVPPQIDNIFYSNENKLLYNGTNELFKRSFRIIQIPSDLLTEIPYNSHLSIITSIISVNERSYLSESYVKRVPVYFPINEVELPYPRTD